MPLTLEEQYRVDVRAICRQYPAGTEERRLAKTECWEQYQAAVWEQSGNLRIIYKLQQRFAQRYFDLVKSFYLGEIPGPVYRLRRIGALRLYARRLFELGLLTEVFDDAWIQKFAKDSLDRERELLPVPPVRDTFGDAESEILCIPLREFSKRFFRRVHEEFGIGRLKRHPRIFGGVDSSLYGTEAAEDEE